MYILYGPYTYVCTVTVYSTRTYIRTYVHPYCTVPLHVYINTVQYTYQCTYVHIVQNTMHSSPGEPVRDVTDKECPLNTQSGPAPADWGRSTFTLHPYTLESLELAYIQLGPCTPETCKESTELARAAGRRTCQIRYVSYIC